MQSDTAAAHVLRVDSETFYLFQSGKRSAPGDECDACGRNSTTGFTTLRIEEDVARAHNTGAWSCCLACAITNAEADQ